MSPFSLVQTRFEEVRLGCTVKKAKYFQIKFPAFDAKRVTTPAYFEAGSSIIFLGLAKA